MPASDLVTGRPARSRLRATAVALVAGLLLGGLATAVAPSVAGVAGTAPAAKSAALPYYTKDQSNNRFVRKPKVLRGGWAIGSAATGTFGLEGISWGFTMKRAPVTHFIVNGDPVPAGCSGTPAAPGASPGHLCVFEQAASGFNSRFVCSAVNNCSGKASRYGAYVGATSNSASGYAYGSWALGVRGLTTGKTLTSPDGTAGPTRLSPGPAR